MLHSFSYQTLEQSVGQYWEICESKCTQEKFNLKRVSLSTSSERNCFFPYQSIITIITWHAIEWGPFPQIVTLVIIGQSL